MNAGDMVMNHHVRNYIGAIRKGGSVTCMARVAYTLKPMCILVSMCIYTQLNIQRRNNIMKFNKDNLVFSIDGAVDAIDTAKKIREEMEK